MAFLNVPSLFPRSRRLAPQPWLPVDTFAIAALVMAASLAVFVAILPGSGALSFAVALAGFTAGAVVASRALRLTFPHARLGLCNFVTMARLALAMALLGPLVAGGGPSWPVFAVAAITLALDGVDGWLARQQGLASDFGARFDMEVDAAFALILASHAATGPAGPVAILLGLPRYLFAMAARVFPWMQGDLPDRLSRKVVCVLQLAVLIALQSPVLPQLLTLPLVGIASVALLWSFTLDLIWLWRRQRA